MFHPICFLRPENGVVNVGSVLKERHASIIFWPRLVHFSGIISPPFRLPFLQAEPNDEKSEVVVAAAVAMN